MVDFAAEEALIDEYVAIKDSDGGDSIIMSLITDHFLPNGRLEEAQSWRGALRDRNLREQSGELIRSVMSGIGVAVFRYPKNKDWEAVDAEGRSEKTDDQQYHYDRTLKYSVLTRILLDDRADVEICRNEWITFVARNAYQGGLAEMGATMETLAQALSDYVDHFLLAGAFDEESNAEELDPQANRVALVNPLKKAASSRTDIIQTLESAGFGDYLDANFIANHLAYRDNGASNSDELIFTDAGIFLMQKGMLGSFNGKVQLIPFDSVSHIEIGSDTHTNYTGFTSRTTEYWTLTINTHDYQSFARWLFVGSSEEQCNQNRPDLMEFVGLLANHFQLTEGDSWTTSGGYKTSYGFFW